MSRPHRPNDAGMKKADGSWAVYEIDQCTSIAYLWDPGFRNEHITTPLPRPFGDYASVSTSPVLRLTSGANRSQGFVTTADDIRLTDVLEPVGKAHHTRQTDFHALRLKALTLLAAAGRLRDLPPENNEGQSSAVVLSDPRSVMTYGGTSRAAFESAPNAFNKLKGALDRFCDELPRHYAAPWRRWDEESDEHFPPRFQLRKDTAVLVRRRDSLAENQVGTRLLTVIVVHHWLCVQRVMERAVAFVRKHKIGARGAQAGEYYWNVHWRGDHWGLRYVCHLHVSCVGGGGQQRSNGRARLTVAVGSGTRWSCCESGNGWMSSDAQKVSHECRFLYCLVAADTFAEARKVEADMDIILHVLTEWQTLQAQHPSNRINVAILNNQVLEQCRQMSVEEWAAAMAEVDGAGT